MALLTEERKFNWRRNKNSNHSPMGINGDCLLFLINLSDSVSFSASVIHCELNCWAVGAILPLLEELPLRTPLLSFDFTVWSSPRSILYLNIHETNYASGAVTSFLIVLTHWRQKFCHVFQAENILRSVQSLRLDIFYIKTRNVCLQN